MLIPLSECVSQRPPVPVDENEDGVGNFPGKGLVAVKMLHAVEHFRVGEVFPFMDVCLTKLIVHLTVEIFRSKSSGINGRIARIALCNDMLLNKLHGSHVLCFQLFNEALCLPLRTSLRYNLAQIAYTMLAKS